MKNEYPVLLDDYLVSFPIRTCSFDKQVAPRQNMIPSLEQSRWHDKYVCMYCSKMLHVWQGAKQIKSLIAKLAAVRATLFKIYNFIRSAYS